MPGSALSVAGPATVLNTIVADVLDDFAGKLEESEDINKTLNKLIRRTIREHKRIIFNGDGYSDEWKEEAARRGLSNLATTVDALPAQLSEKSVGVFSRHGVFTKKELHSRYDIMLENYCKTIHIEALTLTDIVNKQIIPASLSYQNDVAGTLINKAASGIPHVKTEEKLLNRLSELTDTLTERLENLISETDSVKALSSDHKAQAFAYETRVLSGMESVREIIDELELIVSKDRWPVPTYDDLLYSVK